jgi:hypothetical protein
LRCIYFDTKNCHAFPLNLRRFNMNRLMQTQTIAKLENSQTVQGLRHLSSICKPLVLQSEDSNDWLALFTRLTSLLMSPALGPSQPWRQDRPETVPEPVLQQPLTLIQTLIQQSKRNQTDFTNPSSFGEAFLERKGSVAGPQGFEPWFSGSEGRCLNPDWATGPEV